MKEQFKTMKFQGDTMDILMQTNVIVKEYSDQGFNLTLRQLYYQFVSRDIIPNTERSYKRLGTIINNGRLCGIIDWSAIEDRTRNIRKNSHWDTPNDILESAAHSFAIDKWFNQDNYIEVWIEKDALIGVIEGVCTLWDLTYFSCRGYVSQSEMYRASIRFSNAFDDGKNCYLFHLGDHDPSGIDMTRDIQDRLYTFGADINMCRLALDMKQVRKYKPPPNPAKITDSRFHDYSIKYGDESWELDALTPKVIVDLIQHKVSELIDHDAWDSAVEKEEKYKKQLVTLSKKKF